MTSVPTNQGQVILSALIKVIQDNKQYLSDIDGLIGDGDHGINMNKGFTLCQEELGDGPCDLSHGLKTLYQVLMTKIGGSMGPLYGMLFKAMAKACKGKETLDAKVFGLMLLTARDKVLDISGAQPGDKTLLDTLIPAQEAYQAALEANESFGDCLGKMSTAAEVGRDKTKDMIAKVGRSSRLGERSRGVLDAGATSCCLILQTLATTIQGMLVSGIFMNTEQLKAAQQATQDLIRKSGLVLSKDEWSQLAVNDMGLGDISSEGFAFVDILRSERLRITVLVLLPNQTLPQHVHPPYENEPGKEETLRVLYGHTKVFVEGKANPEICLPKGKEQYYTARREIALDPGDQYTVAPGIKHWFQAGPEGSVNMTFQNRVDETKNIFDDPNSLGCPIKLTD